MGRVGGGSYQTCPAPQPHGVSCRQQTCSDVQIYLARGERDAWIHDWILKPERGVGFVSLCSWRQRENKTEKNRDGEKGEEGVKEGEMKEH